MSRIRNSDDKMCPIIWNMCNYSLTIAIKDRCSINYNSKSIVRMPLRKFMKCGAIWSVLKLSTIFWEKPLFLSANINPDITHNEQIKASYLISFASDLAPICKAWAKKCIDKIIDNQPMEEEVFAEIILIDESLKDTIIDNIVKNQMEYSVHENIYTIIDNENSKFQIDIIDDSPSVPNIKSGCCIICLSNPSSHAFVPCGHKHICRNCSKIPNFESSLHNKCPTCRKQFTMIIEIYED